VRIPLQGFACSEERDKEWMRNIHGGVTAVVTDILPKDSGRFKSLKLEPETTGKQYRPAIIQNDPIETTKGDYTYRFLGGKALGDNAPYLYVLARNDEPLYDYLDKGFFYKQLTHTTKSGDVELLNVVSDEYNVNTAKIFMMLTMQPALVEMLQDGCFINSYEAEMLCLRMAKKMDKAYKTDYDLLSQNIETDYKKNTTLLVVGKLLSGDVERTTINSIQLSKTSATYDHVSIEADDLLTVLYKNLDFNSEFDIYTIVDVYSRHVLKQLEIEKVADPVNEEEGKLIKEVPTFKINNISISASVSSTHQRYVNKQRINKEEISKVIYRASCHRNAEDYTLFLKSISKMSMKWHDVVANGLGVKIHSTITAAEYTQALPGPAAPTLNFELDKADKCVKLVVSKDRKVKISLAKLVKKVESLNDRTDNGWIRSRVWTSAYSYRSYGWCQEQLVHILIEAATFITDFVDAEGRKVERKEVLLTKDDIIKVLEVANEAKKAVIEKSKEFLKMAVDLTGAEEIVFMNEKAYKVTGAMRSYVVIMKNAKVYDYETKQYRCIVNDHHYAGAGYDDVAARLLALKNDGVMQTVITTLKGAAQPGAENAHRYAPEREDSISIENAVTEALAKV
jgi:hypothetical protein